MAFEALNMAATKIRPNITKKRALEAEKTALRDRLVLTERGLNDNVKLPWFAKPLSAPVNGVPDEGRPLRTG